MIKTKSKIAALAVILFLGAGVVFAQAISPESNASKATFGEITTDVDNFLDSAGYKDIELGNFFLYNRFGANIPQAKLDIGAALNAGSLYLGFYYNGRVTGNREGPSRSGEYFLVDPDPGNTDQSNGEKMKYSARNKAASGADYGVLVGVGGIGIKFTYEDDLTIAGAYASLSAAETLTGTAIPSFEVGLNLGPLSKIGLSLPIEHNRQQTTTFLGSGSGTVDYSSFDRSNGANVSNRASIFEAQGNYVQPDVYVKLDFSEMGIKGFTLENNLRLRLYGLPAFGNSKALSGVGYIMTTYDSNKTVNGDASESTSVWDKRFWIEDQITPAFNFSNAPSGKSEGEGEAEGEKSGGSKFTYSATVALPIGVRFVSHSMNYSRTSSGTATLDNIDIKDFYKGSSFSLGISPALSAGIQYQVVKPFAVQAGINAELFTVSMVSDKTAKTTPDSSAEIAAHVATLGGYSADSSAVNTFFTYPKLSFGAGFTISLFDKAALDFALIYYANPTAAGTIYKAVGDGLGSGDTSVVLSLKF